MRKLITYQGWSDLTAKSWHKKPNLLFTITDSRASVEAERSFQFCFVFFLKMLWYCSCFSKFSPNHKILYLSAQVNSQTLSSWKLCEFLELGWELVFFQARFFFHSSCCYHCDYNFEFFSPGALLWKFSNMQKHWNHYIFSTQCPPFRLCDAHFAIFAYSFAYPSIQSCYPFLFFLFFFFWQDRETDISLLLHPFIHSLVAPCMCTDGGWNPQPWCIGLTLQPTEQLSQGNSLVIFKYMFLLVRWLWFILLSYFPQYIKN